MKFTKALLGLVVLALNAPAAQGQMDFELILQTVFGVLFGRCPDSNVCNVSNSITYYEMRRPNIKGFKSSTDCKFFVNFWYSIGWTCGKGNLRRLASGELEVPSSLDQVLDTISHIGGQKESSFKTMENVLNVDQCASVIEELNGIPQARKKPLDVGDYKNFHVDFSFQELLQMVGKEGALRMYSFFQDAFPGKAVTQIMGRRMEHEDDAHVKFHDDADEGVWTMMITLNDDFQGGESIYLNSEGVHVVGSTAGGAVAHAPGIVHAAKEINGVRYSLFLVSGSEDMNRCMMGRNLLN